MFRALAGASPCPGNRSEMSYCRVTTRNRRQSGAVPQVFGLAIVYHR
jgi:hypothetical protein